MHNLSDLWLTQLIRGILALIFAAVLFAYPGITLLLLISIFGIFFAISGIFNMVMAYKVKHHRKDWGFLFFEGFLSLCFGLAVWWWPGISSIVLVYVFAAWLIVTGVFQLANAIHLAKFIKHTFWLGLIGLISLLFGLYIAFQPGQGALAIIYVIGIYAVLYGVLAVISAFTLRKLK